MMDNEEPHFVLGFLAVHTSLAPPRLNLTLMLHPKVDQARGTRLCYLFLSSTAATLNTSPFSAFH